MLVSIGREAETMWQQIAVVAASGDVVGCVGEYGGCHGRRGSV